jgi:hypothetical protein
MAALGQSERSGVAPNGGSDTSGLRKKHAASWFDFFATGDDNSEHRVSRLMVDLATGQITARK